MYSVSGAKASSRGLGKKNVSGWQDWLSWGKDQVTALAWEGVAAFAATATYMIGKSFTGGGDVAAEAEETALVPVSDGMGAAFEVTAPLDQVALVGNVLPDASWGQAAEAQWLHGAGYAASDLARDVMLVTVFGPPGGFAAVFLHLMSQNGVAAQLECQGLPDVSLSAFDNEPIVIPPGQCNVPDANEPGVELTVTSAPSWMTSELREFPFSPVADTMPLQDGTSDFFVITNNGIVAVRPNGYTPEVKLYNLTSKAYVRSIVPGDIPGYVAPSGPVQFRFLKLMANGQGILATFLFGGTMIADLSNGPMSPQLSYQDWLVTALAVDPSGNSFYVQGRINNESGNSGLSQFDMTDLANPVFLRSVQVSGTVQITPFGENSVIISDSDTIRIFEGNNANGFDLHQILPSVGVGNHAIDYENKRIAMVNRSGGRVSVYGWQCETMPCAIELVADKIFSGSEYAVFVDSWLVIMTSGSLIVSEVVGSSIVVHAQYSRDANLNTGFTFEYLWRPSSSVQLWATSGSRLMTFESIDQLPELGRLKAVPGQENTGQCDNVVMQYCWGGSDCIQDSFEACVVAQADQLAALPSIAKYINETLQVPVLLEDIRSPDGHEVDVSLPEGREFIVYESASIPASIEIFDPGDMFFSGPVSIQLSIIQDPNRLWVIHREGFWAFELCLSPAPVQVMEFELAGTYSLASNFEFADYGARMSHGGLILGDRSSNPVIFQFNTIDPANITLAQQLVEFGRLSSTATIGNNLFGTRVPESGQGVQALVVFESPNANTLFLGAEFVPEEGVATSVASLDGYIYLSVSSSGKEIIKLTYQNGVFEALKQYLSVSADKLLRGFSSFLFASQSTGKLSVYLNSDRDLSRIAELSTLGSPQDIVQLSDALYAVYLTGPLQTIFIDLRQPYVPRIWLATANYAGYLKQMDFDGMQALLVEGAEAFSVLVPSLGKTFNTAGMVTFNASVPGTQGEYTWGLQVERVADGSVSATQTASLEVLDRPTFAKQREVLLSAITIGQLYSVRLRLVDLFGEFDGDQIVAVDLEGEIPGSRPPFWINFNPEAADGEVEIFGTKPTGSGHDSEVLYVVARGWSGGDTVRARLVAPTDNQTPQLLSARDVAAFANEETELVPPTGRDADGDVLDGPTPLFSPEATATLRPVVRNGQWFINPTGPGDYQFDWTLSDGQESVSVPVTATAPRRAPEIDTAVLANFVGITKPGGQVCADVSGITADPDGLAAEATVETIGGEVAVDTTLVGNQLCFNPPADSLGKTPLFLVARSGSGDAARVVRERFDVESLDSATIVVVPMARNTFLVGRKSSVPLVVFVDGDDVLVTAYNLPFGTTVMADGYHWTPTTTGTFGAEVCAQPDRPNSIQVCSFAEWRVNPSLAVQLPFGPIVSWVEGMPARFAAQIRDAIAPITVAMRVSNSALGSLQSYHNGQAIVSVDGELRIEDLTIAEANVLLSNQKFVPNADRKRADDFTVTMRVQDQANPESVTTFEFRGINVPTPPEFDTVISSDRVTEEDSLEKALPQAVMHDPGQGVVYQMRPAGIETLLGGVFDAQTRLFTTDAIHVPGVHEVQYCALDARNGTAFSRVVSVLQSINASSVVSAVDQLNVVPLAVNHDGHLDACTPWSVDIVARPAEPSRFEQIRSSLPLSVQIIIVVLGVGTVFVVTGYTVKSCRLEAMRRRMAKAAKRLATQSARARVGKRGDMPGELAVLSGIVARENLYLKQALESGNWLGLSESLTSMVKASQKIYFSGHVTRSPGLSELAGIWQHVSNISDRLADIAEEGVVTEPTLFYANTLYILVTLLMGAIRAGRPISYERKVATLQSVASVTALLKGIRIAKAEDRNESSILPVAGGHSSDLSKQELALALHYLEITTLTLRSLGDRDSAFGWISSGRACVCCFTHRKWSDLGLLGRILAAGAGLNPGQLVQELYGLWLSAPEATFLKPWLVEQMRIAALTERSALQFVLVETTRIWTGQKDRMPCYRPFRRTPKTAIMLVEVLAHIAKYGTPRQVELAINGGKVTYGERNVAEEVDCFGLAEFKRLFKGQKSSLRKVFCSLGDKDSKIMAALLASVDTSAFETDTFSTPNPMREARSAQGDAKAIPQQDNPMHTSAAEFNHQRSVLGTWFAQRLPKIQRNQSKIDAYFGVGGSGGMSAEGLQPPEAIVAVGVASGSGASHSPSASVARPAGSVARLMFASTSAKSWRSSANSSPRGSRRRSSFRPRPASPLLQRTGGGHAQDDGPRPPAMLPPPPDGSPPPSP